MGRKIANRYEILELIGQGGTGEVYKAHDALLERVVAIKKIRSSLSQEGHERLLLNEARLTARVQHPNILPIYDVVQDQETLTLHIVMPLISSKVTGWMEKAAERPLSESVSLLQGIAEGLDFLHRQRFLHRDLNPGNIFVDDNNKPYIADFGLAIEVKADEVYESAGELAYTAPEVLNGDKASYYSDQYAFGVLAFEVITGRHPFHLSNSTELINAIYNLPMPSIGEARPELSKATIRDVDAVLARMTAKEPRDRYERAGDAVEDLNRIVYSGQQIIEGKIFISYARKDKAFVYALADELERYRVTVWVDRDIEYGSAWDQAIENQLNACDVMLVVATPNSMQSAYVTHEWSYFMGTRKPILPFVPHLNDEEVVLHSRLQRLQCLKGTDDMAHDVSHIIGVISEVLSHRKNQ